MKSKVLLSIAAITAVVVAAISFAISTSQAQPVGNKQFQFVLTGTVPFSGQGGNTLARYEDPQYNIVCYTSGVAFSCVKK